MFWIVFSFMLLIYLLLEVLHSDRIIITDASYCQNRFLFNFIYFYFYFYTRLELTSWYNCSFENPSFLYIKKWNSSFSSLTPLLFSSSLLPYPFLFYSLRFWFLHIFLSPKVSGTLNPGSSVAVLYHILRTRTLSL